MFTHGHLYLYYTMLMFERADIWTLPFKHWHVVQTSAADLWTCVAKEYARLYAPLFVLHLEVHQKIYILYKCTKLRAAINQLFSTTKSFNQYLCQPCVANITMFTCRCCPGVTQKEQKFLVSPRELNLTFIKFIKHSNRRHLQPSIVYSLIIWDN